MSDDDAFRDLVRGLFPLRDSEAPEDERPTGNNPPPSDGDPMRDFVRRLFIPLD